MFTKNFGPVSSKLLGLVTESTTAATERPLVLYDGSTAAGFYSISYGASLQIQPLCKNIANGANIGRDKSNTYGVCFGTGSTPPSVNDYKLSGEPISGLTSSNVTVSTNITTDDSGESLVSNYTIQNTTGTEITIGEVGLFYSLSTKTSSGSSSKYQSLLLERAVFEAPITIPADGFGQVIYTIRLNYPT